MTPCAACLSGLHVYGPALRGIGQRCRCGATRTVTDAEEARREAIRVEQCRAARCPCKGNRSQHDLLVALNDIRHAEQDEQAARYAVTEAQEGVQRALAVLSAAQGRLRDRGVDVVAKRAKVGKRQEERAS